MKLMVVAIGVLGFIQATIGRPSEIPGPRDDDVDKGIICTPGERFKKDCNYCFCMNNGRGIACTYIGCFFKKDIILESRRKKRDTDDMYKDQNTKSIPFDIQQELQKQRYLQQQQDYYDKIQLQQDLAQQRAELAEQQAELAEQNAAMESQLEYQHEQDLLQWEEDEKQHDLDEQQYELEQQQQLYDQEQQQLQDEQYFKKIQ